MKNDSSQVEQDELCIDFILKNKKPQQDKFSHY